MGSILFLFIISCLSCFNSIFSGHACPVHFHCNDTLVGENEVKVFCKEHSANMVDRCCILNETVIGLDLRNCGISVLNLTSTYLAVEILDMRENELEKFTKNEFNGLTKLDSLFLPPVVPCPGGDDAWSKTNTSHEMTKCFGQLNPCDYMNITCTINGRCDHVGPGSAKCNCIPGHHGYKCMNDGDFPTTEFCLSLIIPTTVLCIVCWFVVGRDPLKYL